MLHYLLIASNMQGSAGSNQPGHVNTASVLHSLLGPCCGRPFSACANAARLGLGGFGGGQAHQSLLGRGCCPVTALACLRLCWHLQVTSSAHHHLPLSDQPQW